MSHITFLWLPSSWLLTFDLWLVITILFCVTYNVLMTSVFVTSDFWPLTRDYCFVSNITVLWLQFCYLWLVMLILIDVTYNLAMTSGFVNCDLLPLTDKYNPGWRLHSHITYLKRLALWLLTCDLGLVILILIEVTHNLWLLAMWLLTRDFDYWC